MLDLVISGGTVVTPHGVGKWDIGIADGTIAIVAQPGAILEEADRTISADEKLVIPGGIEPHAHLWDPITTQPDAHLYTLGPEADTVGMAFGGVTTHLDFCFVFPDVGLVEAIERRHERWRGNSHVDYSFHVCLSGPLAPDVFEEIPNAIAEGFPSFKAYTCDLLPPHPMRKVWALDTGRMALAMEKISENRGILAVHGEENEMVQFNYEMFRYENRMHEGWNQHLIHTKLSESLAFWRTILLAEATEAAVYFVHASAREGVDAIRVARAKGLPVYGETLTQYMCHNAEDYKQPRGFCYHTYPSVKLAEDQDALWAGILDGGLATTATDEFPTTLDVKLMGTSLDDVTGGNLGAEARLGIVYAEGVCRRGMSLQRFVDVTSSNAARIFGFWPKKGAILPGSDADLVIFDPGIKKVLTRDDFHVADYSPWEGWSVEGWPVTTILRGMIIVDDGELVGKLSDGQLVKRKIDASIVERPVL